MTKRCDRFNGFAKAKVSMIYYTKQYGAIAQIRKINYRYLSKAEENSIICIQKYNSSACQKRTDCFGVYILKREMKSGLQS